MCIVQYSTVQYSTVQYSILQLGQALWARSNFGVWYAAVGVVKMLHTDNKQKIRKLIQSPSKRIPQNWSGPIKLGPTCSTFICFQYLTLTFTRSHSRYRGTQDCNKILYYIYTYFTQGSGF